MMHGFLRAAALALAFSMSAAQAQTLPYQQAPSVYLSNQTTHWRVDESWNDDHSIYTFFPDGTFRSSISGATGAWVQTGARVVIDWPSYEAVYIGRVAGDRIVGIGLFDSGQVMGTFVLTRVR